MTNDEMVRELASFFDDPKQALVLIQKHLIFDEIRRGDGTTAKLEDFHGNHKEAHRRRELHGVPHKLDILEFDLTGYAGFGGTVCSSGLRPPNLDDMERQRTEPEYVYRPGRRKTI